MKGLEPLNGPKPRDFSSLGGTSDLIFATLTVFRLIFPVCRRSFHFRTLLSRKFLMTGLMKKNFYIKNSN